MSNFVARLQALENARTQQTAEKNRLEATVNILEKNLQEFEKNLLDKGIDVSEIDDIDLEIANMEQFLEEKLSRLEKSFTENNNQKVMTTEVNKPVEKTKTASASFLDTLDIDF